MEKIKILIADNSYLIRQGLASLILKNKEFVLIGEAETAGDLHNQLQCFHPQVLIIDYASRCFCTDDVSVIHELFPEVHILAITQQQSREVVLKAIESGITGHLWKDCGEEEILEAISCTAAGQKYMCEKIVELLIINNPSQKPVKTSCEGIKLSERETEIIQLIALGLVNKQIAERLFISTHTVNTHRKNIMSKLGTNNTASLLLYALRENIIRPDMVYNN